MGRTVDEKQIRHFRLGAFLLSRQKISRKVRWIEFSAQRFGRDLTSQVTAGSSGSTDPADTNKNSVPTGHTEIIGVSRIPTIIGPRSTLTGIIILYMCKVINHKTRGLFTIVTQSAYAPSCGTDESHT